MIELLQQVLNGLATGAVYAGLALAVSVAFQGTGMLNFGQGAMATLSAYAAYEFISHGLSFWLALPLVVVLSFLGGALMERVLVRPVEGATPLALLTVSAGLLLGLSGVMGVVWGTIPRSLASPFGNGVVRVGGVTLTLQQIGAVGLVAAMMLVVGAFFRFTSLGLQLRAVAQNPASSRLLGISVGRMLALGWGLAAAVGAVAGLVAAPSLSLIPEMMDNALLLSLAAATLGGFESRLGAVVGGLLLGVSANLASRYVPGLGGDLQLVVPLAVIFVVLLTKPAGLFGRASAVRA